MSHRGEIAQLGRLRFLLSASLFELFVQGVLVEVCCLVSFAFVSSFLFHPLFPVSRQCAPSIHRRLFSELCVLKVTAFFRYWFVIAES